MTKEDILRKNPVWKKTFNIVSEVLAVISAAEVDEDEKWGIVYKLRYSCEDALQSVSLAVGGGNDDSDYDWRNARRNLFAFQSNYLLAVNMEVLKADPDIVVSLDNLVKECQKEINEALKRKESIRKKEIDYLAAVKDKFS